ncbi:MAG: thiamine/thiamine pyrophosphate ABC transporter permease ThiP [Rubrimonas sp.]|uniref:thiamine/thiamine pyrophosphate ABC transporter permease ThiP n=1 Tax=Rubrimonas sp. TaxID=2036015 RepID=UPI002FDE2714
MARRAEPLALRPPVLLAGLAALAAILSLTGGAAAVVAWRAEGAAAAFSRADWAAVEFTVTQAALSAALSVLAAIPLARALARRRFAGRAALIRLIGAPFLLPVVVAALGVVAVWGRNGWLGDGLAALGLPRPDVYGLPGVLLAHVFFNLPLAARLILQAYSDIPPERWRAAAQLGVEGWTLFRLLEGPALRRAAPGALAVIFGVCAASFTAALMLGGGPRATTLELAIWQAAVFEFDLARAARLASLQLAISLGAALAALALAAPAASGFGGFAAPDRWDGRSRAAALGDAAAILAACLFLGAPLLAVALRGAAGLAALDAALWARIAEAALRSLIVAAISATLALAFALPLAALSAALEGAGARRRARLVEAAGLSPLAASPFVLGIALFVLLRPFADPVALALPLTALVNAAMAAPFALRLTTPALAQAAAERGRLADALGLRGLVRLRALYWPALRRPLGFAAGLAAALAAGDLGVIALFSAPDAPTLPLLMSELAGSRRIDAAHAAGLILIALAFALFWACDRLIGGRA